MQSKLSQSELATIMGLEWPGPRRLEYLSNVNNSYVQIPSKQPTTHAKKKSSKISGRHPEFFRKLRNSLNVWNLLPFWILWRFQWISHKKFIYVNAKLGKSVTLYHKLAKRMFTRGFFVVQTLFVWRDTKRMRIELGPHGGKHFKWYLHGCIYSVYKKK